MQARLLLNSLVTVLAAAALLAPAAPAQTTPGAPPVDKLDRDGDKVFEDVEARLGGLADTDRLDVIVVLRAPALPARVAQLRADGLEVAKRYSVIDAVSGRIPKGRLRALARRDLVRHVELDSPVELTNDTAQSSFGVTAARVQAPGLDGNADGNANAYSANDLVAAVIDSGIDATHQDLDEGKVIGWRDLVDGSPTPYDDHGHGTHVSATLAGDGDARADRRYAGVAPAAALVGVKVFDAAGNTTATGVLDGIEWVVDNRATYGIEVLNMSLGAPGCHNGTDADSLAVNAAQAAGLVVAVSAGNSGPGTCTIGTPGVATGALTVGSMADLGVGGFYLAFDSSRGLTADGRVKPDVVAPGVNVTSAEANSGTGYVGFSGTSMASPFVAGVALLMLDAAPALTPQAVKDKIMQTALDWGRGPSGLTGSRGSDREYGAGRLDAYAALGSAGAGIGPSAPGPDHELREGTMSGPGATTDYFFEVRDTSYPITATLIHAGMTAGSAISPDFDIFLYNPSGTEVASSEFRTRQEELTHQPAATGTYRLRVLSFRGSGDYFVDVSGGLRFPGYARPVAASPVRVSLVTTFRPCAGGANRVHGPPLAHPSCNPPVQRSNHLTVGTPDANGLAARFVGHLRFAVLTGDPGTPADEADVAIALDMSDVRRVGTLADYPGQLQASVGVRQTDRASGAGGDERATTQDFPLEFAVPCTPTADTAVGSDCALSTTADALTPGLVAEGKRTMWQLGQVEVRDGGADGVAATAPNTPFAVQGLFVP